MRRFIRPADVLEAVRWYTGADPTHDSPRTNRNVQARRIYWAALSEIGLSGRETEILTGNTSVNRQLVQSPPADVWVSAVLERCAKMIEAEED